MRSVILSRPVASKTDVRQMLPIPSARFAISNSRRFREGCSHTVSASGAFEFPFPRPVVCRVSADRTVSCIHGARG